MCQGAAISKSNAMPEKGRRRFTYLAGGGLAGDEQINCGDGDGEDHGDQSLEKGGRTRGRGRNVKNQRARAALAAIEQAGRKEKGPECECDRQGSEQHRG